MAVYYQTKNMENSKPWMMEFIPRVGDTVGVLEGNSKMTKVKEVIVFHEDQKVLILL